MHAQRPQRKGNANIAVVSNGPTSTVAIYEQGLMIARCTSLRLRAMQYVIAISITSAVYEQVVILVNIAEFVNNGSQALLLVVVVKERLALESEGGGAQR